MMAATTIVSTIGTPIKRDWFTRFVQWCYNFFYNYHKEITAWRTVAKENAKLQQDVRDDRIKDPAERALINAKLEHDAHALVEDLERNTTIMKRGIEVGEKQNVDETLKELKKIEKAVAQVEKKKKFRIQDIWFLMEYYGRHNAGTINGVFKNKIVRYKKDELHIESYAYRFDIPYIKFAEIEEPVKMIKEELEPFLDKQLGRVHRGLVSENDVTAEHVIEFIKHARKQGRSDADIFGRLKTFRVKSGVHETKIDNLDLADESLHYVNYPADIWVNIDKDSLRKGIIIGTYMPAIAPKLKKTYAPTLQDVVKGVDEKGRPLSPRQFDQLSMFDLTKDEISVLKVMSSSLKIKKAQQVPQQAEKLAA